MGLFTREMRMCVRPPLGLAWRAGSFMRALAALLLGALVVAGAQAQAPAAPAGLQQAGMLKVAFYKNFSPFSQDGKGIDVDIAEALAARLGLRMSALWFDADENMEDDLRNMVWKGHYLGYGPADVMMHVPVDRDYMARNERVTFFAPYHRERYALARNLERVPVLEHMSALEGQPVGVEGDTLAATVMLGVDGGRHRATLKIFKSTDAAIAALRDGQVAAVLAQLGELEAGLGERAGFKIEDAPIAMLNVRQWPIGLAVKSPNVELARSLQEAMNALMADGTVRRIMETYGVRHRSP